MRAILSMVLLISMMSFIAMYLIEVFENFGSLSRFDFLALAVCAGVFCALVGKDNGKNRKE